MLLFAFLRFAYIIYEAAFVVGCPYSALTPELTGDHDERTSLVTYRMAVSIEQAWRRLLLGLVIFPMFPARDPQAYQTVGYAAGLAFIPPLLIVLWHSRAR